MSHEYSFTPRRLPALTSPIIEAPGWMRPTPPASHPPLSPPPEENIGEMLCGDCYANPCICTSDGDDYEADYELESEVENDDNSPCTHCLPNPCTCSNQVNTPIYLYHQTGMTHGFQQYEMVAETDEDSGWHSDDEQSGMEYVNAPGREETDAQAGLGESQDAKEED